MVQCGLKMAQDDGRMDLRLFLVLVVFLPKWAPRGAQACFKMASRPSLGSDPSGGAFLGVPSWFPLIFFDDGGGGGDGDV